MGNGMQRVVLEGVGTLIFGAWHGLSVVGT